VKIAYHPIYCHPLPKDHRFPMEKYELIPQQLIHHGIATPHHFFQPKLADIETILLTHTSEYVHKLLHQTLTAKEQRRIGFPQSPELTQRELIIAQGTIDCCLYALQHNSVALNIAGGTHHAFANRGEGFCLLNDFAVAANYLLHHQLVQKILIVDLDVHQGNGTANLFQNSSNVFTFSMHGKTNYPFVKEQSSLDVPLENDTATTLYLQLLCQHLPKIIQQQKPNIIMYLSGVDILDTDKFGKLKVTLQGCKERDEFVFNLAKQHNIPVAVAMGGGYSQDIKIIVNAHCNTYMVAAQIFN
jgi:acetoin utilization deacetylase AcuC-like enzyme